MNTYQGGCHCGAVTMKVEADIAEGIECNCSHCAIKGLILTFVPKANVVIENPDDNLTTYQFNKKHIDHVFCRTCGVQPFGSAGDMMAVNLRCLENFDLKSIEVKPFDGKSL